MTLVETMVLVEKETKVEEVVYTLGDAVVEIEVPGSGGQIFP